MNMIKWNRTACKHVLLTLFLFFSCCSTANSDLSHFLMITSKSSQAVPNTFTSIAKLVLKLKFDDEHNLKEYRFREIRNALTSLAASQSTLKSLDGLTHKLRSTIKDNSSLQSRFKKYIIGEKKNGKEAGKLYEYTNAAERGLQATEILQSVSFAPENERLSRLNELGLLELKRIVITRNGIRCTVSVLVATSQQLQADYDNHKTEKSNTNTDERRKLQSSPWRYLPNELIVAIVDDNSSGGAGDEYTALVPLLTALHNEAPVTIEMSDDGFSQEEISLQPSMLSLSRQVLSALEEFILPVPSDPSQVDDEVETVGGVNADVRKKVANKRRLKSKSSGSSKLRRKVKTISTNSDRQRTSATPRSTVGVSKLPAAMAKCGRLVPSHVRLVGHSAGGAVAVYVSMVLDGTLRGVEKVVVGSDDDGSEATETASEDLSRCTGAFHNKVRCIALGPPPCVSRSVIPQYIRTIICGDDMVVRATRESLETFARRLLKALQKGAGSSVPVGYVLGARWMGDVKSVAANSLKRYTGSKHDISTLSLPGRVIFAKTRKIKSGATMQRVLRGNWQEDVLWQLHEIMPSKKMLEHHSLENYIQTLNRC